MKRWIAIMIGALACLAAGLAGAVTPFEARYEVLQGGRALGIATLRVVPVDATRWRVDLVMDGKGLAGLAGVSAEQSTVFDVADGQYRPLGQSTVRRVLFTRKQSTGTYDWQARSARWTGDVKPSRRAPVALQPGDMSGLLINLAVIRDAAPGRTLEYRYVDTGRMRPHRYLVGTVPEEIAVGELRYSALRVDRVQSGAEANAIWVADGVPTPIRLLQTENGEDAFDLRLIEYRGASTP